ncbi:MAG: hypothetical protein RSG56_03465, partial [Brevundimonas sp.]
MVWRGQAWRYRAGGPADLTPLIDADLTRPETVLPLLDFAGVAVFAATGALAAAREKHDLVTFAFFGA